MATQVQFRRGNTSATGAFTGAIAEITVDTDKKTVVVHDGSTAGGIPLAKEANLTAIFVQANASFDKANSANVLAQQAFDKANSAITANSVATLNNKTFDVSVSSNNIFSIQGQSIASYSGSGQVLLLQNSPTISVLNLSDSQLNLDGGTGSLYWSGQSGVAQAGDLKAGVYSSDPASNNSLFTFGGAGANVMSVGIEGSLFIGTALPSNDGGLNTTYPGWLVVQSGAKFGGTINTLGALQFDDPATANVIFADGTRQNTAYQTIVWTTANSAFDKANSANVLAQSAFNKANNALANTGGSITGDLTITGNLTIVGQQVYANTQTVLIKDNIITLNAAIDQSAAPSVNAGIEVDRGSSANVYLLWNETSDTWQYTNDGSTYLNIADGGRLDAAFSLANGTAGVANTDVTNISITTGTYGNSTHYPVITLSANGRVNTVTTVVVQDPSALAFAIALG